MAICIPQVDGLGVTQNPIVVLALICVIKIESGNFFFSHNLCSP